MSDSSNVSKVKLFEFYAKFIWPIHRLFVRESLSRRCRKCIISEKQHKLENGLCPFCFNGIKKDESREINAAASKEFDKLMREHEGKSKHAYDALVLVSGGKDSAYLLYRLKKDFPKLRILTCTIDNGFFSLIAKKNTDYLIKKLDTEHIVIKPMDTLFKKAFRHALTHLGARGCSEVVDRMDGDLFHDIARNLAAERHIPLLISGVSLAQIDEILKINSFEIPPAMEHKARTHSAGFAIKEIFNEEELKFWWDPGRYPKEDIPRFICPYYVWRLDEEYIKKEVVRLGLIKPGNDHPMVTNNALIPVMGVVDFLRLGYSSFASEFAGMIREGKAERRLWINIFEMMEISAKRGWFITKEVHETLNKLDLTLDEVTGKQLPRRCR
jgi:hypothetical protein